MSIKNPFKTKAHRKAFDECVRSYEACAGGIRRANGSRIMNSRESVAFWEGYDGIDRHYVTANDRNCLGYVYWRAGWSVRKAYTVSLTFATRCG